MIATGERYRTVQPVPVTVWWEFDTVAVLDDYSEWREAVLPVGEMLEIEEVEPQVRKSVMCRLDRGRELVDLLIPRKQQNRILCFRLPTPYRVEIKLTEFVNRCEGPLSR